jgi:photosystem II stability/assembly factor-like uncharacterized protein
MTHGRVRRPPARLSRPAASLGRAIRAGLAGGLLLAAIASAQPTPTIPYTWKNVQIVGGGFVDGIIFHPTAPGVRYARTDMGSAYRWSEPAHRWEPILDWMSYADRNLMGVESIAVDPADADLVYLACGTYTSPQTPNGAILRSHDRGRSFDRIDLPFKFGGNEDGRGNGERLAVDPRDGRILMLGTRHDGLWTSRDRAQTWTRIAGFPDVTETPAGPHARWRGGSGIIFILFDPTSGTPSSTLYAGVSLLGRPNLFRSRDGGSTWTPVDGAPREYRPTHGVLASDGTLYLSYGTSPGPSPMKDGGVWKLDPRTGGWTDITPIRPGADGRPFGYAAVAVDPRHPRTLIASTFGHRLRGRFEDDIFRSTDGGATWKPVFATGGVLDASLAPYVSATPLHWLFDLKIDPANSDHALCTTGYGGWETFDLSAMDSGRPTTWQVMATGVEETVAIDLLSPTQGAPLISAVLDYGGFVHWDLDRPPPDGEFHPPYFDGTSSLASPDPVPAEIVRVGQVSAHHTGGNIAYSLDGGHTWKEPHAPLGARWGTIAVSADGRTWLWAPRHEPASVTRDRGDTWVRVPGLPVDTRVIADRVDPNRFYGLQLFAGKLLVSTDAGATFHEQPLVLAGWPKKTGDRGDNRGGQDRLYATPAHAGDLWLAAFDGLYHSSDAGLHFNPQGGVDEIHAFGFGRAAPERAYPALYLAGVVRGQPGFFRSDDAAASWVRINDDQHQLGLVLQITGDPKRAGRVYVGTHGRGILYGDPAAP